MWKIPLFVPDLNAEDCQAVAEVLQSGWLTMGDTTHRLEEEFARRLGVPHALAVSNGTAALHLALAAAGIAPGDEVLLPALTFVACANVVRMLGATPVFVDLASETDWTLSLADLEHKITPRSTAVMAVHYAGFPCAMDAIVSLARRRHLFVIEDCAHSLFSSFQGQPCGTFGDAGAFSFFSNKNMTTGEGGMIVTADDALAETLRLMRSHGMTTLTLDRYRGYALSYDVKTVGLNYRLDEMRSALGLSQLQRLDSFLERRREIYTQYRERLASLEIIAIPFPDHAPEQTGIHFFPIRLRDPQKREAFMRALQAEGIQTSIHYPPIHLFSAYADYRDRANCPRTERIGASEVTLPFYPSMTDEQVQQVCAAIRKQEEG